MGRRPKPAIDTEAGILLGYEITEPVFGPVLDLASKGERGWKWPVFLQSLLVDPSPLLLHERWFVDAAAVKKAFAILKGEGVQGTEKLEYVFKQSKSFEMLEVQKLFNTPDDVDCILGVMRRCDNDGFSDAIEPLQEAYGDYAWPNNFQFERMNAGIMRVLSAKFPRLTPLDDCLRAPVYEYLGLEAYKSHRSDQQRLEGLVSAAPPLLALPRANRDWDPTDFVKIHRSQGAGQLREIVHDLRVAGELSKQDLERRIDRAKGIAESLAPTREVVYAFAGLCAATLTFSLAIPNPLLLIPSAAFVYAGVDQVYTRLQSRIEKGRFRWLHVAEQIANWVSPDTEHGAAGD